MILAGIPVPDRLVLELSRLLRDAGMDDTGETLEHTYDREARIVALSISDREGILRVLDDPPPGLGDLCGVLLAEHTGRLRDGLA